MEAPLLTTLYGTVTLCLRYHQHPLLQGDELRRPSRALLPGKGGERKLVGRERKEEGAMEAERLQSAGSLSSWGITPLRTPSTGSLAPGTEGKVTALEWAFISHPHVSGVDLLDWGLSGP